MNIRAADLDAGPLPVQRARSMALYQTKMNVKVEEMR
jgi:hypothetical protein